MTYHYTHVLQDFQSSHSNIVVATEDGGSSYSSSLRLWSAVCDKVFECTEYSADRTSSAVPAVISRSLSRSTVVQQIVRQVDANAIDPRTQRKAYAVCIDNCGPSSLAPQEFTVRSTSVFSEWQAQMSVTQYSSLIPGGRLLRHRDTKFGPTVWQIWGKRKPYLSPDIIDHHNHKK